MWPSNGKYSVPKIKNALFKKIPETRRGQAEEQSPAELSPGQIGVPSLRSCSREALVQIPHFLLGECSVALPLPRDFSVLCVVHVRTQLALGPRPFVHFDFKISLLYSPIVMAAFWG